MGFSRLAESHTRIGFVMFSVLEVALGIDNLVLVAILANKAKPDRRDRTRVTELGPTVFIRIIMLALMAHIMMLTHPPFSIDGMAMSGKDIIMFAGGILPLYKTTTKLHERLEGHNRFTVVGSQKKHARFWGAIMQILIFDAVLSVGPITTAVAMADHIVVAMAAIVAVVMAMVTASRPLIEFVNKHPAVVMLCLDSLLMIGFSLIVKAFHFRIPRGYLYTVTDFLIPIELFNQVSQTNSRENDYINNSWREHTAENVPGVVDIREGVLARAGEKVDGDKYFEENEKSMIRSMFTLAECPIMGAMIPCCDIERLDISRNGEERCGQPKNTPYSRLPMVGKVGVDGPLGYINKKDLPTQMSEAGSFNVQTILRQSFVLPDSTTALNTTKLFHQSSADYALAVDKFGAVLGMATIRDLLEIIAGELPGEFECEGGPAPQGDVDESLTVNGPFEYAEPAPQPNLPPQEGDADFHTVANLIMEELQNIPNAGDAIGFCD